MDLTAPTVLWRLASPTGDLARAVVIPGEPRTTLTVFVNDVMDRAENFDDLDVALFRAGDLPGHLARRGVAGGRGPLRMIQLSNRHRTTPVRVGGVTVGGGAPVVVQSMTMTDTADARGDGAAVHRAGGGRLRDGARHGQPARGRGGRARDQAAHARRRLHGAAHRRLPLQRAPAAHALSRRAPRALDKYRINPGNVGTGRRRDEQFATICKVAVDHGKPVRIGVNGGSLNQELVMAKMQENTDRDLGLSSEEIVNECMVLSALQSTELALESGLAHESDHHLVQGVAAARPDRRVPRRWRGRPTSRCTSGSPRPAWASRASCGRRRRWASCSNEGIGDTIRVSLTPRPGGDRREEVYAACEILQALGLRSFAPSVTACPGCGRTTSTTFQELAERVQDYIRERMPDVEDAATTGVETMTLAVMGCVVNGPGESKAANIGISLPGTGEAPNCPVFIDGEHVTTLRGTYDELAARSRRWSTTTWPQHTRREPGLGSRARGPDLTPSLDHPVPARRRNPETRVPGPEPRS